MHCGQTECMGLFLFSYICWGLLCALKYDQFWKRFHGLLRWMYIVQKLNEIFCRHARSIWSMVWFSFRISLLVFCLDDLSIGDRGVLKSPTTTVLEFICVFRFLRVCLMKLGALMLGAYRLIIVISFWCISPLISMECLSLFHLIKVGLKSALSKISISTPACFWGPLPW
jgi:hypothetical protein